MSETGIFFDHVHLVSEDPESAASWYEEKLGGSILGSSEAGGSLQVLVAFEGAKIIIRGQRTGEQAKKKDGLNWGTEHFGFHVRGDFNGFCDDLRKKGVPFTLEPRDFTPTVRIAFIEAPDNVSIELLQRKG